MTVPEQRAVSPDELTVPSRRTRIHLFEGGWCVTHDHPTEVVRGRERPCSRSPSPPVLPALLGPIPHQRFLRMERDLVTQHETQDWGRGDWMQTFTGKAFYALDPTVDSIDVRDIAHALSMLCRYGGHVSRFYSVAEHSVLMSRAVAPEHALWALLHDATEAYMGDLIRPLKRAMPTYAAAEDNLMAYICTRFGLPIDKPREITEADTRILLDERDVFLGASPQRWGVDIESVKPLGITPVGWGPSLAEWKFLERFDQLALRPVAARDGGQADG